MDRIANIMISNVIVAKINAIIDDVLKYQCSLSNDDIIATNIANCKIQGFY